MDARRIAWMLALAGFIPFAVLAGGIAILPQHHPLSPTLSDAVRTYAAVILSFLGGIRWGMALTRTPPDGRDIAISVAPSLAGWFALFFPPAASFGLLLLAVCAQGAWDSLSIHAGLGPRWFAKIRIVLTILVAAALAVALTAAV